MNAETPNQPLRLGRIVRAHLPLIVAATVVGLALGFAASTQVKSSASATTSILLNPLEGNPFYPSTRGEQLINLGTEAEALRSNDVAGLVAKATGTRSSANELLDRLSVENPTNTQVLDVTYKDSSEQAAVKISQAFADAFLQYRTQRAEGQIGGQVAQLDQQIQQAQGNLTLLSGQIAGVPNGSAQAEVLRQQSQSLTDQVAALTSRRSDLTSLPRDPGQVVTPATADSALPVSTGLLLIIAGGLVGAAAGLAIAIARSAGDSRIHSVDDLDALDVPVLGTFGTPDPDRGRSSPAEAPIGVASPEADEQIRRIRVALLAAQPNQPCAVLVAGTSHRDYAPLVVAELAGSLARSGLETIVLQATLRASEPQPLIPPGRHAGLSQILLGRSTISDALLHVAPLLWTIPVGDLAGEVSDLFLGDVMQRLISDLKQRCDVVLVSTDLIQDGATQSLTRVVDGVVLEIDQHISTTSEVQSAVRTLRMLNRDLNGVVLLGPRAEEWARSFRPHLTMPQRELAAGKGALPPAGGTSGPDLDGPTPPEAEDPTRAVTDPAPEVTPLPVWRAVNGDGPSPSAPKEAPGATPGG